MEHLQTSKESFSKTIKNKLTVCFIVFIIIMVSPKLHTDESAHEGGFQELLVIAGALEYLGTPYVYAGVSKAGMDCSGFVYTAFKPVFEQAPRVSKDWNTLGIPVTNDFRPADILLFANQGQIFHVAIYIGDNYFIHSASQGPKTGVIISSLDEPYWKQYFYSARRLWYE